MELDYSISDLVRRDFDFDAVEDLFRVLEINALNRQLDILRGKETVVETKKDYHTIIELDDLSAFIGAIQRDHILSIDLETTSVDPMLAQIVGFSFACQSDAGVYIPVDYLNKTKNNFGVDELTVVLKILKPVDSK